MKVLYAINPFYLQEALPFPASWRYQPYYRLYSKRTYASAF